MPFKLRAWSIFVASWVALLILAAPLVAALAAGSVEITGVSATIQIADSSTVTGGVQASKVTVSPALASAPGNSVTLKAGVSGISNLSISSGSSLVFTPDNYNKPQDITISIKGTLTSGQSGSLTLSGSGIVTKTVAIQVAGVSSPPGSAPSGSLSDGNSVFSKSLVDLLADPTGFVYKSWAVVRIAINALLIIALLAISFSNILRINIDTYTVKKALPNLVIGVILANASFLIVKYMADISTVATYFFVGLKVGTLNPGFAGFKEFLTAIVKLIGVDTISALGVGGTLGGVAAPILLAVLALVSIVILLWLAFILYIRLVAIYLLTIIAPLAFVAYGVPGMDKYFKQWWQQFIKWLFILPAMSAIFWLMIVISNSAASNSSIAEVLIMYALLIVALGLPSKMGGAIVDKASKAFHQYTGLNAARKYAGDEAKNYGNLALSHTPGVNRLQEWNKLRKENFQKNLDNRRKLASVRARTGLAGLNEARLNTRGQTADEKFAQVKGENEKRYFNSPAGKKELRELIDAELKKRTAEADRENIKLEIKIDYLGDDKNKELVSQLHRALFDQKRAGDELELGENIAVGNEAFSRIQILRSAEEHNKHKKARQRLIDSGVSETDDRVQALDQAIATQVKTFDSLKATKENEAEFGKMDIDTVGTHMDKKDDTQGRLWAATLGRGGKIVNESIMKQNEQTLKEGTAEEITEQLDDFLAALDDEYGKNTDESKKMKQLFVQGKTAEFQLELDARKLARGNDFKGPKIRDGLLATELQKKIMTMTGDYRNEEIVRNVAKVQQEVLPPGEAVVIDDAKLGTREGRGRAARELSAKVGMLVGPPAGRVRRTRVPAAPTTPKTVVVPPKPSTPIFTQADIDAAPATGGSGPAPETAEQYRERYHAENGIYPEQWESTYGKIAAASGTPKEAEEDSYGDDADDGGITETGEES